MGLTYALPQYDPHSRNFLYSYTVENEDKMLEMAADTRPIVHTAVMQRLMHEFIAVMVQEGTTQEKSVYAGMTPEKLVWRLLSCRPLTFWTDADVFKLKDGTESRGGFETVGGTSERHPLTLDRLMSYDEMPLSAMVGVSVRTPFFNSGARDNRGVRQAHPYPLEGVYTGLVGARFEREGYMEHAHVMLTPTQNTERNGYGRDARGRKAELLRMWAHFYGLPYFPTWQEALQEVTGRYVPLLNGAKLFDRRIYKLRMRMVIEPFLLDAEARARERTMKAYVHNVGLGIGCWAVDLVMQADVILEVYADLVERYAFHDISTLDFSLFPETGNRALLEAKAQNANPSLRVLFSQRSPAEPVGAGEFVVAMYAWDSNAYPGNEYWSGALDQSGDPAAAACSAIAVLQNPDVNPYLRDLHRLSANIRAFGDQDAVGIAATGTAVSAEGVLRMCFKEPLQQRHLFIDDDNKVHLMMPVVGGEEIGTDNTCQTVIELQRFFGKRLDSHLTKNSAAHVLQRYAANLKFDLRLLRAFGQVSMTRAKSERLEQVEAILYLLKNIATTDEVNSLQGAYPEFPPVLQRLIGKKENMLSVLLSPEIHDEVLRMPGRVFTLARGAHAPFRTFLCQRLRGIRLSSPLNAYVFGSAELTEVMPASEQRYTMLQTRLVEFLRRSDQPAPTFRYATLQQLKDTMMVELFDNMREVFEWMMQAEGITIPGASVFHSTSHPETLCIMLQLFLGLVNAHAWAYAGDRQNFGQQLDAECGALVPEAVDRLCRPSPEEALLEWAQGVFGVELSHEVCALVLERFRNFWLTVRDSPHLDEFLMMFPDVQGVGVVHQGCICVPFATFVEESGCARPRPDEATHWVTLRETFRQQKQAFDALRRASEGSREPLRHTNAGVVSMEPLEVSEEAMMRHIQMEHSQEVAEMLLATMDDGSPLYRRLLQNDSFALPDWAGVKVRMISMIEDQAGLDLLSQTCRSFEQTSRVWLRVTSYIARSIYCEVSSTVPNGCQELLNLSNEVRPEKLHRALRLLSIDVEMNDLHMSEYYDGYTICMTQQDKDKLLAMHERRRKNFHITQAMARMVYMEVQRRFGEASPQYCRMQGLDNRTMRNCSTGVRHQQIRAPPKMFEALRLLDIIVPEWQFNHYDGYIVSASAEAVDTLERTVEWSRHMQQQQTEGGRPAAPVARGQMQMRMRQAPPPAARPHAT